MKNNRLLTLFASLIVSVSVFAQWTKPAEPASTPLAIGQESYLYNKDAGAYFVGANDYGTRASVSATLGHKVYIEAGTADGSYYLSNYVLQGWMANQIGYMFVDGLEAIYVDNTKEGKTCNQYTFQAQADGTYLIGLSNANTGDYTDNNFPGACLGLIPEKNDTRLYMCETEGNYDFATCQVRWVFVTPAEYTKHVAAVVQYQAAVALGSLIDEASSQGVDITAAKAVYDNTSSTAEQLDAARTALAEDIKNAGFANATASKPYTVAFFDFEDKDASAWTSTVSAQNKGADNGNNAADYAVTGIHYENWHPSNFAVGGKIYATAQSVPAGVYRLTALAFTSSGTGANLFVGNGTTTVAGTNINATVSYEALTFIEQTQNLEYGLQVEGNKMNWVGLDNVRLEYLGSSAEAYKLITDRVLAEAPVYDEDVQCEKALYTAYKEAKDALTSATEPAAIAKAIEAFEAACAAIQPSVAAYDVYKAKIEEAAEWLDSASGSSDEVDILSDYIGGEEEPEAGVYNGNGTSQYILLVGLLNAEQIAAETSYLDAILTAAKSSVIEEMLDCTDLIKNPDFTTDEGWSRGLCTFNMGPDGAKVAEGFNIAFDVNQTITGVQNGIYELTIHGFARNAGYDKAEYSSDPAAQNAYVYMNDFEQRFAPVESYALAEVAEDAQGDYVYRDGVGYVPNMVNAASAAFAEGAYEVKLYAVVTDGTLKIGIRNDVRYESSWVCWSGVRLVYCGQNEEVVANMAAELLPVAQSLTNNHAGQSELSALTSAIANLDADAPEYDALLALNVAIDNVKASTNIYAELATSLASLKDAIDNNTKADAATVAMAQGVYDDAQAAYTAQTYTIDEAEAAVAEVSSATVSVKMGKINASEDNPVNFTSAIVNPTFDPARGSKADGTIEGWITSPMNGYKQNTASYNKAIIELNQTLSGLPKGKYKVTVHTYYRAGYWNEEEAYIANGDETHLTTLYAQTSAQKFTTPVMNLTEGAIPESEKPEDCGNTYTLSNGLIAPDGTSPTVSFFNAGHYLNELRFEVPEDGQVTIGLSKTEILPNDYEVVGAWELWYMGDGDEAVKDTIDMTDFIVNNTFDPARGSKADGTIEGWVTSPMNGYKQNTASYNKAIIDLNQTVKGLEPGRYLVTVKTYYRAGYWNEEEAYIANGDETHLTTLYAQTSAQKFTTPVMNLTEGAIPESEKPEDCGNTYTLSNGLIAPDGTSPTVSFFNAGHYLNKLEFVVPEDGQVTIGLSKTEILPNDYEVVGEWRLYRLPDEAEVEEEDYSDFIVNNTFDPARGSKADGTIEGWVTSPMNGYKQNTASYNKAVIDLNQTIKGLPEGTYKVTVQTYYRAGYWNEEEAYIANGDETHLTTLYAQTADQKYSTPVMNLTEGAIPESEKPEDCGNTYTLSNGLIAPDGTSPTVSFFNAGHYMNELFFYVGTDGTVTIGLSKTEILPNDYEVVGAWHLYYYGSGNTVDELSTDIQSVEAPSSAEAATPVEFYSISGVRLSAPQKGVNIVKMSNNEVKKIFVK